METNETKKRIRKTKEEILKKVETVNNMEKIIKGKKCNVLWLAYRQGQMFEKLKMNDKILLNMVKFIILFKTLIVKFVNKNAIVKKSSLSLHFLKNNFKIIKEICHENASEFK